MQILFLIILAVVGGISFAVQVPVNAALGKRTGVLQASFVSFAGGALLTAVIVIIHGSGKIADITQARLWQILGGLYGATNVCISVAAIPVLGAALTLMAILLGQLLMGTIIDGFGLFESEALVITPMRVIGLLAVGAGILLIYLGSRSSDPKNRDRKAVIYLVLSFIAGMLGAIQSPSNASLAKIIGSWESSMVSFIVGMLGIFVILLFTCKGKNFLNPGSLSGVKWWMLIGGAFGVGGVFLNLLTVGGLGTALQVACSMLGQLGSSLVIDTFGLIQTPRRKANGLRVSGVGIICLGVILVSLA